MPHLKRYFFWGRNFIKSQFNQMILHIQWIIYVFNTTSNGRQMVQSCSLDIALCSAEIMYFSILRWQHQVTLDSSEMFSRYLCRDAIQYRKTIFSASIRWKQRHPYSPWKRKLQQFPLQFLLNSAEFTNVFTYMIHNPKTKWRLAIP